MPKDAGVFGDLPDSSWFSLFCGENIMVKKSVQRTIDRTIKSIWLNEICEEYGKGFFILEASLQNSFYHHLRCKLGELLIEMISIFTRNFILEIWAIMLT